MLCLIQTTHWPPSSCSQAAREITGYPRGYRPQTCSCSTLQAILHLSSASSYPPLVPYPIYSPYFLTYFLVWQHSAVRKHAQDGAEQPRRSTWKASATKLLYSSSFHFRLRLSTVIFPLFSIFNFSSPPLPSPRPPAQDKCERIKSLPAFTAPRSTPLRPSRCRLPLPLSNFG
jgi:hypothetical protein